MRLHRLFVHAILLVVLLASPQPATGDAATGPFILMDLGTLGGNRGVARAVNNSGQVVGTSSTAGGEKRALSWTAAGGMVDLGTLGGTGSTAVDVNNRGQVVGNSSTAGGKNHAFSWTAAGGMVDLGTLGGTDSFAAAVNDSGQVVGLSSTAGGVEIH